MGKMNFEQFDEYRTTARSGDPAKGPLFASIHRDQKSLDRGRRCDPVGIRSHHQNQGEA